MLEQAELELSDETFGRVVEVEVHELAQPLHPVAERVAVDVVAAWIGEECFASLDAPVRRVAAKDCHVAYEPTLERAILPQVEDIAAAARALLSF